MDFKPTKWKIIISLIIGFVIGLIIGWQRMKLGWRFNLGAFVLFALMGLIAVYVICSLFKKKK